MKFEEYLCEKSSKLLLDMILEIRINLSDPDIKHLSRFIWHFTYKGNTYKFGVDHMLLSNNRYGFLVEWGLLKDGKISTDLVKSSDNVIGVFEKVMSCMAMFLKQEQPESFSMSANVKLARVYDTLWLKFSQDSLFKGYFYKDRKVFKDSKGKRMFLYHYSKNMDDKLSENELHKIIDNIDGKDIIDFETYIMEEEYKYAK